MWTRTRRRPCSQRGRMRLLAATSNHSFASHPASPLCGGAGRCAEGCRQDGRCWGRDSLGRDSSGNSR
eukprot:11831022-Alexandrium_andersonii.AAC.1